MISKKLWNSFSVRTREKIINRLNGSREASTALSELVHHPYKHDFDHDQLGITLKALLSCCNLQPNGTINVVSNINPEYAPAVSSSSKVEKKNTVKAVSTPQVSSQPSRQEPEECVWYVDYEDKHGDLHHTWCNAESKERAIEYTRSEYWDIKEIVRVYKPRN